MKFLILLALSTFAAATFGCRDETSLCSRYDKKYCQSTTMRKICKKHCGLYVATTPTPVTKGCRDKYSRCYKFNKSLCKYDWFKTNCEKHCGFCGGVTTLVPTQQPTSMSSKAPTQQPTKSVTQRPTISTTQRPTNSPSQKPTNAPTKGPTQPQGQCGRPQVAQSRVVGGKTAAAHSWPWQIGLHHQGRFMCGGSVINSRWVVTAAHCVHRRLAKDFTVKLGDHDRQTNENEQTIQVSQVISHKNYGRLNNDIALLELEKPVMFGKHVQPVCLPKQGDKPAVGSTCYITGWGKIQHPGSSTRFLQQLGLKVQPKSKCQGMNGIYAPVTDQMLCAANPETSANQSGCHGDSGGPFVCQNGDGSWTLHGAVSWGSPRCDIKEAFTVFARVAEFRTWMDQYIV